MPDAAGSEVATPRGVALLCNRDGVVQAVLRDDLSVLGSEVVGQPLGQWVDPSSREKTRHFLAEVLTKGAAFDWEVSVPHEGAVRLLHIAGAETEAGDVIVVGAPSRQAAVEYYDELMRMNNEQTNALRTALKARALEAPSGRDADVYERLMRLNNELANVQRELTKKNLELERANALKNQFLGMAAHDLRNPIGAIRSFSLILRDSEVPLSPERHDDFLRRITKSSEFMLALINDLLDISSIEAGQLRMDARPTDIAQLTRENIEVNRLLATEKDIDIRLDIAGELPEATLDGQKMEQVLNNLLSNAVKFSQPGTTVHVRAYPEDNGIRLDISDQGPGISCDEVATLFRPFQRASARGTAGERSTGLGLAIVKRIVEGHLGRIWCESELGRGTTFSIWLPAAATQGG